MYESILFYSQLKSPGLVTNVNGKNKTLYMSTVKSIEEATKPNLKMTLKGEQSALSSNFISLNANFLTRLHFDVEIIDINHVNNFSYCVIFPELGLVNDQQINVADPTSPNTLLFKLQLTTTMDKDS